MSEEKKLSWEEEMGGGLIWLNRTKLYMPGIF